MAQSVKSLVCRHNHLSLGSQHSQERQDWSDISVAILGGMWGHRWSLNVHWSASLLKSTAFRVSTRSCFQKMWRATKGDIQYDLWLAVNGHAQTTYRSFKTTPGIQEVLMVLVSVLLGPQNWGPQTRVLRILFDSNTHLSLPFQGWGETPTSLEWGAWGSRHPCLKMGDFSSSVA